MATQKALSTRNRELLKALSTACGGRGRGWATPQKCGGTRKSHHARSLEQLWRLGLAERQVRDPDGKTRAGYAYRITDAGMKLIAQWREEPFDKAAQ